MKSHSNGACHNTIVLAFSGGLDTTYCTAWLSTQGWRVVTATVDTGGFTSKDLAMMARRSRAAGSIRHITLNGVDRLMQQVGRFLIYGDVARGLGYPLCVAAERVIQVMMLAEIALSLKGDAVAHGCTGAGNDQMRFEIGLRALAPNLPIVAPIAEQQLTRQNATAFLAGRGLHLPSRQTRYSINQGLLGTTFGGGALHHPELAVSTREIFAPVAASKAALTLTFRKGLPVQLNGKPMPLVRLLSDLNQLGRRHGLGRGIHVGTTILGVKGRIAYEAPGLAIIYRAHQELEAFTLTHEQLSWKKSVGEAYGDQLHRGLFFNPVMRDFESFLASSQAAVTGVVTLSLHQGKIDLVKLQSPQTLMNAQVATYGESHAAWDARDAAGFRKLYGLETVLAARRARSTWGAGGAVPAARRP